MNNYTKQQHKPPRFDLAGFETSDLKDIALGKLKELQAFEKQILRRAKIEDFAYKVTTQYAQEYSETWIYAMIYLYKLEKDRGYVKVWKKYWKRVGGQTKSKKLNGFTDDELERARSYPIEELAGGSFKVFNGKKKMLCPFHTEKTPSFLIFQDNHFHCFGCGVSGKNAIDFMLMKDESLDFKETVRRLL